MTIEYNNKTYEVKVTRRRYGRTFFTWIDYFKSPDGVCYSGLCDPFPCAVPKKSELIELLKEWMN